MATPQLERTLGAGSDLLLSAQARAAALARAAATVHSVAVPSRVWRRPDAVVAFTVPVYPGASLAEVRTTQLLSVGECLTVGVGVAKALAAMHGERLAHGDVSAANVVVRGTDVVVVDTMGALSDERGTAQFAAPERVGGATPAGDVFALGALLRHLVEPAGQPVIEAWTAPLLAEDPAKRPSAAHAALALARCAPALPVRMPDAPVTAAMRAGAEPRTLRRPADRWWRIEKAGRRLAPLAGIAVVATIVGSSLVPALADDPQNPSRAERAAIASSATSSAAPSAAPAQPGATDAAMDLTRARVAALANGNAAALGAITASGSEAAAADAGTREGLASGTLRFDGLELESVSARLVREYPGGAIVEVTSALSGYSVGQAGTTTEVEAATAVAVLKLALTERGWRVAQVLPPP